MTITDFRADADLVGRRVRLGWTFRLAAGETLAAIPSVTIRRKTRDFEFPPTVADDPFLVYDSDRFDDGTFHTGIGTDPRAADLPDREVRDADGRVVTTTITVSSDVDGRRLESTRRTTHTRLDGDGQVRERSVEILDTGSWPHGLLPGTTYHYELTSSLIVPAGQSAIHRATVTPTDSYGLGRTLYESLPAIHRRHDVVTRPPTEGAEGIPEASPSGGQLRRLMDILGVTFDSLRGTAEGIRGLHDVDHVDHRLLPLLADWIGWDLSFGAAIPVQRHEIRYAAALYRMTGTIPGCRIWVKRLTGWEARIKEFSRNVFFTNHLPDPNDPRDNGSRTVDTDDPDLLAAIGTFDDHVDYTYDTGTTDRDWYAYNVEGIFVRPNADETASAVMRKKDRLSTNFSLFLPFNVRGVVILELDTLEDAQDDEANLLQGAIES